MYGTLYGTNLGLLSQTDLEHVVDELSDGEGDEEAGEIARKRLAQAEEKARHAELMRRMRDGYDGRRGGIASGTARGNHRFDQLVATDNREDAKRCVHTNMAMVFDISKHFMFMIRTHTLYTNNCCLLRSQARIAK